jgi:hypothetical protein
MCQFFNLIFEIFGSKQNELNFSFQLKFQFEHSNLKLIKNELIFFN